MKFDIISNVFQCILSAVLTFVASVSEISKDLKQSLTQKI